MIYINNFHCSGARLNEFVNGHVPLCDENQCVQGQVRLLCKETGNRKKKKKDSMTNRFIPMSNLTRRAWNNGSNTFRWICNCEKGIQLIRNGRNWNLNKTGGSVSVSALLQPTQPARLTPTAHLCWLPLPTIPFPSGNDWRRAGRSKDGRQQLAGWNVCRIGNNRGHVGGGVCVCLSVWQCGAADTG